MGSEARRVVSLVPSITEGLALARPEALVGVTDWCTHPAALSESGVVRVRGTKNPDLKLIESLHPDIVIANKEENRELDVRRLRQAGIEVWVSEIESLSDAFNAYDELFTDVLGWRQPHWLSQAKETWSSPSPRRGRVAVPIWRDPWMVVGSRTFTSDLLARAGWANAFGAHADRYPKVNIEQVDTAGADLILLPDEPYVFSASDGPEAFSRTPAALISGRLLTWYGPSLSDARTALEALPT